MIVATRRRFGITVASIGGMFAVLVGCRPVETVVPDVMTPGSADQIMTRVVTNLAVDGRRKNYVRADSAFTYQEAQRLEFVGIKVTIFDIEGQPTAELTAKRGVFTIGNQVLDARGDVVVVTPRGDSLRSARVSYDNVLQQFRSDSSFVFKAKSGLVEGKSFTADPELRNFVPGRTRP